MLQPGAAPTVVTTTLPINAFRSSVGVTRSPALPAQFAQLAASE